LTIPAAIAIRSGANIMKARNVHDADITQVVGEMQQMQSRVMQTLVPTILALGLISFAGRESINYLSFGGAFAVLFTSSLYVSSLSYKIFRNAAFLSVFNRKVDTKDTIYYENLMKKYRSIKHDPPVIHAETTTAAIIYLVLSITFFFIFFMEKGNDLTFLIAIIVATVILLFNCLILWLIYINRDNSCELWEKIRDELIDSESDIRDSQPTN
jgi:hypothetical protein